MKDSLGDRMKTNYEQAYKIYMPHRMPVIIRLDGKTFHTFTKKMNRPFDEEFVKNMAELSKYLVKELQTAVFAYAQSDEISILLHDYKKLATQPLYNNEIQKLTSISAGLASSFFSLIYSKEAVFDSRVFTLPEAEVCNYFIWRQKDASRNSIQMLARSLYSHKQLVNKNTSDLNELIFAKGQNWNNIETKFKRGYCIKNGNIDFDIPLFNEDRNYIEDILQVEQE